MQISLIGLVPPSVFVTCAITIALVLSLIDFFNLSIEIIPSSSTSMYSILILNFFSSRKNGSILEACSTFVVKMISPDFSKFSPKLYATWFNACVVLNVKIISSILQFINVAIDFLLLSKSSLF